jgi:hypothetical protein
MNRIGEIEAFDEGPRCAPDDDAGQGAVLAVLLRNRTPTDHVPSDGRRIAVLLIHRGVHVAFENQVLEPGRVLFVTVGHGVCECLAEIRPPRVPAAQALAAPAARAGRNAEPRHHGVAARGGLGRVGTGEVEPTAHDPFGNHAGHDLALSVADLVESLCPEVPHPGTLNRGIVIGRLELGVAVQRVVDAEKLRVVVVEVLHPPGPGGPDVVFTEQLQEGRRKRQVREDDPGTHLFSRQQRVGCHANPTGPTVLHQDLVDGAGREDVAAVSHQALDQRMGQRVGSARGGVHRHGHHGGEPHHLRADATVEGPLAGELAQGPGQRTHELGFVEHLEQLEAGHSIDVVTGERDAQRPEQPVVEGRHAVGQGSRGRRVDRLLVDGERLDAVLHRVRPNPSQGGRVALRMPRDTVLGQGGIEGENGVLAVEKGLREQHVGALQIQPEPLEVEIGHGGAHRRHQPRRVGVVEKPRQPQLDGVAVGAALAAGLEDADREPGLRQVGRRGQPVDAAADHRDVVVSHRALSSSVVQN